MKITDIIARADTLCLALDEPFDGCMVLTEEAPLIHAQPVLLDKMEAAFHGGKAELPRYAGEHDRAFDRFALALDDEAIPGARYCTGVESSAYDYPYPKLDTIKSLNCRYEIGAPLGCDQQGRPDVNLPQYMSLREQPGTIPYRFEGTTYYIFEDALRSLDELIHGYKTSTVVVLNSPRSFGSKREKDMLDVCLHPNYEDGQPHAFISAFNMTTPEGQKVFAAFISFLAENYARSDMTTGRITGAIISNEINLQNNWGNMGEATPEYYMEEYTEALRLAWIAGARQYSGFRVYISLANNWNLDHAKPLRYYRGRKLIDLLGAACREEGDFPWHVAFHPYPESFDHPDFWNDRSATFDFATMCITYRNMEVLEKYLAQPQLLYKGQPRRILFSEQGFNSGSGPLSGLMQKQAAAGYVLSFMKARNMPTVDMMTHHATIDNPHEFGLSLGIYKNDPTKPYHKGEAKPIEAMVRAMDTPFEAPAVAFAREVVGAELFDYLLTPPEIIAEPEDLSNAFG